MATHRNDPGLLHLFNIEKTPVTGRIELFSGVTRPSSAIGQRSPEELRVLTKQWDEYLAHCGDRNFQPCVTLTENLQTPVSPQGYRFNTAVPYLPLNASTRLERRIQGLRYQCTRPDAHILRGIQGDDLLSFVQNTVRENPEYVIQHLTFTFKGDASFTYRRENPDDIQVAVPNGKPVTVYLP